MQEQIYLGTDAFVGSRAKPAELKEAPRRKCHVSRPSLTGILRNAEENAAITKAYREHSYTMKENADHFSVHYATVSRRLRKHEQVESTSS